MDSLEGTSLGPYRLLYKIGQGGMADVYLAEPKGQPGEVTGGGKMRPDEQPRRVAIKVLPAVLARDPDFAQRFEREARYAAQLLHPHILPIYSYSQDKGYPYLVMAYAAGGTLATILKERGRLTPREAEPYILQIGGALSYAHKQGIIHRDIKPSNLLLDENGDIYLADFGIAKLLSQVTKLTKTGAGVGTPEYMSPEQVKGQADSRSDIYALGIVIYQMLTGEVPFTGESSLEIALKQLTQPVPPLKRYNPAIPLQVQTVVMRALEKDITRRYQKVTDLVHAYQDAVLLRSNGARRSPAARQRLLVAEGQLQAAVPAGQAAKALPPAAAKATTPSLPEAEEAGTGWKLTRRSSNRGRRGGAFPDLKFLHGRRWLVGSALVLLLTSISFLLLREGLQSTPLSTQKVPTATGRASSLVPVNATAQPVTPTRLPATATHIPRRKPTATPTVAATATQPATPIPTDVPPPPPVPTSVPTSVPTPGPVATSVPAPTATVTPKPKPTSTPAPKPTATPSPVPTSAPTVAPTDVPTAIPTETPGPVSSPTGAPITPTDVPSTPVGSPTGVSITPTSVPSTPVGSPTGVSITPTGIGVPSTPASNPPVAPVTPTGVSSTPASTPLPLAVTTTPVISKPTATAVSPTPTGTPSASRTSARSARVTTISL